MNFSEQLSEVRWARRTKKTPNKNLGRSTHNNLGSCEQLLIDDV